MTDLNQENSEIETSLPLIGDLFKNIRIKKGYSIDEIATHLRVSTTYIEAIEQINITNFPERVYILGFVQSYAKFLGLNPSECVERFKIEVLNENQSLSPLSFSTPLSIESSPNKKIIIFTSISLFILLIIGYGIWYWEKYTLPEDISLKEQLDFSPSHLKESPPTKLSEQNNINASNDSIKSNFKEETSTLFSRPDLEKKSQDISKSAESSLVSNPIDLTKQIINFEFIQPTWVQIKNSTGHIILEKIFQPGESYNLEGNADYHLYTGNAGGIKIKTNQSPFKLLGKPGEVLSHLSLEISTLSRYLETH